MNPARDHNLKSPFADQREQGFRWLRFSDFVEEEFRQYYAQSAVQRARFVVIVAIGAIVFNLGARLTSGHMHPVMLAFYLFVMLPVLGGTLYMSTLPARHRQYTGMLALAVTLMGLVVSSFVTRASLGGASYAFAALITWIFIDWLVLGLPFRHAARTATLVSCLYVWGTFHWDYSTSETGFAILMLVFSNVAAALCCYQLEYAVRRSFLESKVLGQLAERDGLTGLYNRRSYDEHVERIWRQSRREQTPLTILLIDIDHFKAYNDLYGHQAGDDALKKVAMVIGGGAQRPLDFAARYGGEEFAMVLYGPAGDYGRELPEQLRNDVRGLKIPHRGSSTGPYLTVSIGVAMVMPGAERSLAGAVQMADEALYEAKEQGRNSTVIKESLNTDIQTGRFRASERATA